MRKTVCLVLGILLVIGGTAASCSKPATALPSPAAPAVAPAKAPAPAAELWPKMVRIGTKSAGSSSYSMAVAIFKVIEEATGHRASPAPVATASYFATAFEEGKLELAIGGNTNFRWPIEGKDEWQGKRLTTSRMISGGAPYHYLLTVRPDSGIKKLADIKGKRILGNLGGSSSIRGSWKSLLAAAQLSESDVTFLPIGAPAEMNPNAKISGGGSS